MSRISNGQIAAALRRLLDETGDDRYRAALEAMAEGGLLGRKAGRPTDPELGALRQRVIAQVRAGIEAGLAPMAAVDAVASALLPERHPGLPPTRRALRDWVKAAYYGVDEDKRLLAYLLS